MTDSLWDFKLELIRFQLSQLKHVVYIRNRNENNLRFRNNSRKIKGVFRFLTLIVN